MPEPLDLAAIRARHAEGEQIRLSWPQAMARQAHADRGALLAALDGLLATIRAATDARDHWHHEFLLRDGHYDRLVEMHRTAQAALDRLAAITVDEIAQAIAETRGPSPSGVGTVWHGVPWATANQVTYRAMAAAVLALLHARLNGPCPRTMRGADAG